jgi:hypothetical protein
MGSVGGETPLCVRGALDAIEQRVDRAPQPCNFVIIFTVIDAATQIMGFDACQIVGQRCNRKERVARNEIPS